MEKKKRAHEVNRSHSQYIGKAGEHLVTGELLKRGMMVHMPVVDDGVDLVAGGRIRVQVKTRKSVRERLGFNFTVGVKRETGPAKLKKIRAKTMDQMFGHVDVVIFVGLDENSSRFWIIPISVLKKYPAQQGLILGTGHNKQHIDAKRMNELRATGMSAAAIGREMGFSDVAIRNRLNGLFGGNRENTLSVIADKYEGAWHEIEQAIKLANEIDAIPTIEELMSPAEMEAAEYVTGNRFRRAVREEIAQFTASIGTGDK